MYNRYTGSLFRDIITYLAKRQDTVTTSTTEAKLNGLALAAKELIALKRLFKEIQLDLREMWNLFCDNQQTIQLIVSDNEQITTKLQHVDIHNMWMKQEHLKGTFEVTYIFTVDMPADGMTKNLLHQKFKYF